MNIKCPSASRWPHLHEVPEALLHRRPAQVDDLAPLDETVDVEELGQVHGAVPVHIRDVDWVGSKGREIRYRYRQSEVGAVQGKEDGVA